MDIKQCSKKCFGGSKTLRVFFSNFNGGSLGIFSQNKDMSQYCTFVLKDGFDIKAFQSFFKTKKSFSSKGNSCYIFNLSIDDLEEMSSFFDCFVRKSVVKCPYELENFIYDNTIDNGD